MSHGDLTRAPARLTASAAGGAPETQPRFPGHPEGGTSPQVARQGRESRTSGLTAFVEKLHALLARTLLPRKPGPKPKAKQEAKRN